MRASILLGAMICAAPVVLFSATASGTENRLTVDACQPLTSANLEECCADENWQELIWPDDVRFCPPLAANDSVSGRRGELIADNSPGDGGNVPDTGGDPDPVVTGSTDGNPGNQMDVGGAGEKDMDNETPKTGDQGNSN
jgi:hypothetical protein